MAGSRLEAHVRPTELGCRHVIVHAKTTNVCSGGSSFVVPARLLTGGAVKAACERVLTVVLALANRGSDGPRRPRLTAHGGATREPLSLASLLDGQVIDETGGVAAPPTFPVDPKPVRFRHRRGTRSSPRTARSLTRHRLVLVVVALDCAQDVRAGDSTRSGRGPDPRRVPRMPRAAR